MKEFHFSMKFYFRHVTAALMVQECVSEWLIDQDTMS